MVLEVIKRIKSERRFQKYSTMHSKEILVNYFAVSSEIQTSKLNFRMGHSARLVPP